MVKPGDFCLRVSAGACPDITLYDVFEKVAKQFFLDALCYALQNGSCS